MLSYRHIPCWENARRQEFLKEFRDLFVRYLNACDNGSRFSNERQETVEAQKIRADINLRLVQAGDITVAGGISTSFRILRPPMLGGGSFTVDAIYNIFDHSQVRPDPEQTLDVIERAIGVYVADQRKSLWRTLNPFYYLSRLLAWIVQVPFAILTAAGFNGERASTSIAGRIYRAVSSLIIFLWFILHVADYFGFKDDALRLMHIGGAEKSLSARMTPRQ
jgi:hypothetical protein